MEDSVSKFMTSLFIRTPLAYEHNQLSNGPGGSVPSGSESEFYIVPVLSCISDNDILVCLTNVMAFNGFHIVFPADVRGLGERIDWLKIVPYKSYPGFVRLQRAGKMIYNWESNQYDFLEEAEPKCFVTASSMRYQLTKKMEGYRQGRDVKLTGPAIKIKVRARSKCSSYDDVYCICCPKWPLEARDWPTRRRYGDWPKPAMVLEVVRQGCHVVCAQHRACQEDNYQFRFSFSLAEVILLRSWTTTQQLVYHMLRYFAKRVVIHPDCPKEKELLCTYHLKTLMLWTCEEEPEEWWTSSSIIGICCKLLRKMLEWIEKRHCPNYFIPDANLFRKITDPVVTKYTKKQLKMFSVCAKLSEWFVNNYLLVCYKKLTKGRAPHEFGEFSIDSLHIILLNSKRHDSLGSLDDRFSAIYCAYMTGIWKFIEVPKLTDRTIKVGVHAHMKKETSTSVRRNLVLRSQIPFVHLDSVLCMLYAAITLTFKGVLNGIDFVSDVLSVVSLGTSVSSDWRSYHNFPKTYRKRLPNGHVCFLIAQEHMGKLYLPGNNPEFQLMSRLSMHYLWKAYSCRELSSCATRSATILYMAAICFATSNFQAALDLCSRPMIFQQLQTVVTSEVYKRKDIPLSVGCLLFIDDVSNCIGFMKLFQLIKIKNNLQPDYRQFKLNPRLTPLTFAYYLMIRAAERTKKQLRLNWCEIPTIHLMDTLLISALKRRLPKYEACNRPLLMCIYRRNDQDADLVEEVLNRVTGLYLNEEICIRLLMECSLESIATLYQKISAHYGLQCYTIVSCYRALYLFKRSQYDRVLSLCDDILRDAELEEYLTKISGPKAVDLNDVPNWLAFPNILALRPFNAFFDEDLHCLIGLQTICHVSFRARAAPTFQRSTFDQRVYNHMKPRNECDRVFHNLLAHKSFIFQYFLGRHFVARYLKLRCFLLSKKKSVSEIFKIFVELKPQLPFEYVVYQFLRRKLKRIIINRRTCIIE